MTTTTEIAEAAEALLIRADSWPTNQVDLEDFHQLRLAGAAGSYERRYRAYTLLAVRAGVHDGHDLHAEAERFGLGE